MLNTYCINLPERKNRWENIKNEMKKNNWLIKKFIAIKDSDFPFFGCTLSHRKIIERAYQKKMEYVCVIEDDAVFLEKNAFTWINKALKEIPSDWHIFYLWWKLGREGILTKTKKNWFRVQWLWDTHAILYHSRSYKNLLKYLPKKRTKSIQSTQIWNYQFLDHFLWQYYQKKYPCYIKKIIAYQKNIYSDIQKKVRKRSILLEKIQFFMYKNKYSRALMIYIWKILDFLSISTRKRDQKNGF